MSKNSKEMVHLLFGFIFIIYIISSDVSVG